MQISFLLSFLHISALAVNARVAQYGGEQVRRQAVSCNVAGYDRNSPMAYSYLQNVKVVATCKNRCTGKCLSFAVSSQGCLLYDKAVSGNFLADGSSIWKFYDKSCPLASSSSTTTTITRPPTTTTTTTRPATTTTTTTRPVTTTPSLATTSSAAPTLPTTVSTSRPASTTTTTTTTLPPTTRPSTTTSSSVPPTTTPSTSVVPTTSSTTLSLTTTGASTTLTTTTRSTTTSTTTTSAGPTTTTTSISTTPSTTAPTTSSSITTSATTTSATTTSTTTTSTTSRTATSTTTTTTTSTSTTTTTRITTTTTSTTTTRSTTTSTTTTSTTPACRPTAPAASGKRGASYNYVAVTNLFSTTCSASQSKVTWAYNWFSAPHDPKLGTQVGQLHPNVKFVPMLWSNAADLLQVWNTNVQAAKAKGWTEVLGFNEPDLCLDGAGSSCMSVADAVTTYRQYITPLKAQGFRLGAPAVTNGQGLNVGNDWLTKFLTACSDCQIDFIPIHWYGVPANFGNFYDHLYYTHDVVGGGKYPIWVTEFGLNQADDSQIATISDNLFSQLDSIDFVEKYAWFMAGDPGTLPGNLVSTDQKSLTTVGMKYDTQ
ncbi:Glycosyl hydrolase catalytic core domain-containing protein 3 [Elsinoe fawcettii]|nr:Glycosyl hydrolase catalytic core domain-containing protein 3 [Elsinoe fawcettii]